MHGNNSYVHVCSKLDTMKNPNNVPRLVELGNDFPYLILGNEEELVYWAFASETSMKVALSLSPKPNSTIWRFNKNAQCWVTY